MGIWVSFLEIMVGKSDWEGAPHGSTALNTARSRAVGLTSLCD
jgi:hypothetical protein